MTIEAHNRSTRRVTGLAGLGVAVLFGVGNAMWALDQPAAGAPARLVVAFYTHTSVRIIVGANLSLLAAALFILFASGVRAILREHESDDVLATTAFGGAVLLVAAGLGAGTINMEGALRAHDGSPGGCGRSSIERIGAAVLIGRATYYTHASPIPAVGPPRPAAQSTASPTGAGCHR